MADEAAGRPTDAVEPDALPDDSVEPAPASDDGSTHPDLDRVLNSHAQLMRAQGQTNRTAVLATLRANGGMTFAQISAATGLSQSTVKRAVKALTASGDVTRGETGWTAAEPDDRRGDTAA
jgi:DNA-binding transcriptional ArsR family regulator